MIAVAGTRCRKSRWLNRSVSPSTRPRTHDDELTAPWPGRRRKTSRGGLQCTLAKAQEPLLLTKRSEIHGLLARLWPRFMDPLEYSHCEWQLPSIVTEPGNGSQLAHASCRPHSQTRSASSIKARARCRRCRLTAVGASGTFSVRAGGLVV